MLRRSLKTNQHVVIGGGTDDCRELGQRKGREAGLGGRGLQEQGEVRGGGMEELGASAY